jgi:uncharacterized protein (TIGR03083 family)
MAPGVVDTRPLFRPLVADIVGVLRRLADIDWDRPTAAGSWRVRDVAAHLSDTALRRLSIHRDGPNPSRRLPVEVEALDLVTLINRLNASWVDVAQRFSPRVLTDLYEFVGTQLVDFIEALPLEARAIFPVSWAGDAESPQWFDIGREFTEVWHHGAQIRDAVGAGSFAEPRWLRAVLDIALLGLPHAYRHVTPVPGRSIAITITGPSGGAWTLAVRESGRWDVMSGHTQHPAATLTMTDETAWRVLFNALPPGKAAIDVNGDAELAGPFQHARSVIV